MQINIFIPSICRIVWLATNIVKTVSDIGQDHISDNDSNHTRRTITRAKKRNENFPTFSFRNPAYWCCGINIGKPF